MKIEARKYYLTRGGDKVGPMEVHVRGTSIETDRQGMVAAFYNPSFGSYDENGFWLSGGGKSEYDIVSGFGPVVTETVKVIKPGVYGRLYIGNEDKSFLERHLTVCLADKIGNKDKVCHYLTKSDVLDMIKTLTEIAEAM